MHPLRTVVTFRSGAFNTSVIRPQYLNPHSFGDDLAQHFVYELRRMGYQTGEPGQEDFGWYVRFTIARKRHQVVLGYRPADCDWLVSIERTPFLFFKPGVDPAAPRAIHAALWDAAKFTCIRWHLEVDYDTGHEERGMPSPDD